MTAAKPKLAPNECRFLIRPRDGVACVQIGPRGMYIVREGAGVDGERWWQFRSSKGKCYTVHVHGMEAMHCTCPDQLFRRRVCKHRSTIETLYHVSQVPARVPPGGHY